MILMVFVTGVSRGKVAKNQVSQTLRYIGKLTENVHTGKK